MWQIEDLRQAEYNPRSISKERLEELKKSIQSDPDFLHARPIMVNVLPERFGVIIGGNMRFLASKELGMDKVPCIEVSLPIEKEKVWNVRDNSHHGQWDMAALEELFSVDAASFENAVPSDFLREVLSVQLPSFGEGLEEEQGKLDKKKEVKCPDCGNIFSP